MRMSKKRLKYYYHLYLGYVAKGYLDNDDSHMAQFVKGHNYGMLNAYGFALGYCAIDIENDLYVAKKIASNSLRKNFRT